MNDTLTFGGWLKERRRALDLTQGQLARQAGCSANLVHKIEAGERRPSQQLAALLAAAVGIAADRRAALIPWARGLAGPPPGLGAPPVLAPPPGSAAPPAALGRPPLPRPPTLFIGRQALRASLRHTLYRSATRLVTLTGPGGVGKTRLALEVAAALSDDFLDGVIFVDLAAIDRPALVPRAIATALGVRPGGDRPLLAVVKEYLWERRVLLLLDNFEHVLPAAGIVAELLQVASQAKLLVTSRAALGLRGEKKIEVPPLALAGPAGPPGGAGPARAAESEAVGLFVARAQDEQPDFALTPENSAAVAAICARLDGLPLAIELAAARLSLFSPQTLLARLDRPWPLLTGGPSDLPARQQTLRATIAWSYALLSTREQHLFARLAVFRGGCTLEAVEAVCGPEEVLAPLAGLVRHSLVRKTEGAAGTVRYGMLATIAEFAGEVLGASPEADAVAARHSAYYAARVAEAAPHLWFGPQQGAWLDRLEGDYDNLRAALDWAVRAADLTPALQMVGSLLDFWLIHGYASEGRHYAGVLLARDVPLPARVLHVAARLAFTQADTAQAADLFARALTAAEAAGERGEAAAMLAGLSAALWERDPPRARAAAREARRIQEEIGDRFALARTMHTAGDSALDHGDYAQARVEFARALAISEELGDTRHQAIVLTSLGRLAIATADYPAAARLLEQAFPLLRAAGDKRWLAVTLQLLGDVALRQGDYGRAHALDTEARELFRRIGNRLGHTLCLLDLALATGALGDYGTAQRCVDEALTLAGQTENTRSQGWGNLIAGRIARGAGDLAAAGAAATRALDAFKQLDPAPGARGLPLLPLGYVAMHAGDGAGARAHLREAVTLLAEWGEPYYLATGLGAVVALAGPRAAAGPAAQLYGALQGRLAQMGAVLWPADGAAVAAAAAGLAARLGAAEFAAAVAAGQALPAAVVPERALALLAAGAAGPG